MPRDNQCPLCAEEAAGFFSDNKRDYLSCLNCQLVFVPEEFHLSSAQEKSIYDRHENDIHDRGYRNFLSRLFQPVLDRISPGSAGLDFGCGPGPALAEMFRESGFPVRLYDLYYFPDRTALDHDYDFIVTTEVVEHLASPGSALDSLWDILKPGGVLGIMTKRVRNKDDFSLWHYKNDPTHICFFHEKSFHFLQQKWNASLEIICDDVVIFSKPA